jgi:transcriptional regulator with XRE-family HTH domain
MADEAGSTVPRRQLGRYLRTLRDEAGITLDGAAKALECSKQKVWRIENGAVPVRALDVKAMCDLYKASPEMSEALVSLARETRAKGWWASYGDAVPAWFSLYVGLEAAATCLRQYDGELVPGLLQTPEYANALYRLDQPTLPDVEREKAVAVRLQRQKLLLRRLPPAPTLEVILSEAVLRRPTPDQAAMAGQLKHLIKMTELPTVTVRVLPLSAGLHRGAVAGAFVLLDFPPNNNGNGPTEPSTVYGESLTGALYLDQPSEVEAYEDVWISLADKALNGGESKEMINMIIGECLQ